MSATPISLENNKIIYPTESFDPIKLANLTDSLVHFSGADGGTGGGEYWEIYYHLVSNNSTPTIIIALARNSYFRNNLEDLYEDEQAYEKQLQETQLELINKGVQEDLALDYATKMLTRDGKNPNEDGYYYNDEQNNFYLMAWEKKNNQWSNTTPTYFDSNLATVLRQELPFVSIKAEPNRFVFTDLEWLPYKAKVNEENLKFWQNTPTSNWDIQIQKDGSLHLNYSDGKTDPLSWHLFNGKTPVQNALPTRQVVHSPCPAIDFSTTGTYTFEGKIGEKHPIKMEVELTFDRKEPELTGEYWYLNNPKAKFPIKGLFPSQLDKKSAFYRYKNNQIREHFVCYFADCQLTGWWQHLGNYTIDKFTLQLVQ